MTREQERAQERRQMREREGLCVICGGPRDRADRKCCTSCLKIARIKQKDYQQRMRAEMREKGLCIHCRTEKAVEGKTLCATCAKMINLRNLQRYRDRVNNGLCPWCAQPVEGQYIYCETCRKRQRSYNRKGKK